jgi:F-type H+-transporting ATPase subunit alpha
LPVNDVSRFEVALLGELRSKHKAVLDTIRTEQTLTPATEEKLKAVLDHVLKTFS